MAAPGAGEATEAPCWPGARPHCSGTQCPCLQNGATATHQRESPRDACSAGGTETCSLVPPRPPWPHTLPLCPTPDPGSHGHLRPQEQDPALHSSQPKSRAVQTPLAWSGGVGPPQGSLASPCGPSAGKGPSVVTATLGYRPPRPLVTHHGTWASLAAAGPGGGVVSGLARALQVQSRAQARVNGSLSAELSSGPRDGKGCEIRVRHGVKRLVRSSWGLLPGASPAPHGTRGGPLGGQHGVRGVGASRGAVSLGGTLPGCVPCAATRGQPPCASWTEVGSLPRGPG